MIVDLNLAGKLVIVVGGGTEGTRKVKSLLGQECKIVVVSNRLNKFLLHLAKEGKVDIVKTKLKDASILDKFEKPFLVLACTDDRLLNRDLVRKAKGAGAFAYAVDDPSVSDITYLAIVNIGDTLFVAISTKGKSPAMARILRIKTERILKRLIKEEDVEYIKLANYARGAAKGMLKDSGERKKYLYTVIKDKKIKTLIKSKKFDDAKNKAMEILETWR
ncbi:MAG: bifunctional precorrin-2 dehydrogenase/sirohydrochlorin ferrochelatase [Nitrososphaerales archaeon]